MISRHCIRFSDGVGGLYNACIVHGNIWESCLHYRRHLFYLGAKLFHLLVISHFFHIGLAIVCSHIMSEGSLRWMLLTLQLVPNELLFQLLYKLLLSFPISDQSPQPQTPNMRVRVWSISPLVAVLSRLPRLCIFLHSNSVVEIPQQLTVSPCPTSAIFPSILVCVLMAMVWKETTMASLYMELSKSSNSSEPLACTPGNSPV